MSELDEFTFEPCVRWEDDCQGKADYDGPLLSVSSRYWPAKFGHRHSAHSALVLHHGKPDDQGWKGERKIICEREFTGSSKEDVQQQVEEWVDNMSHRVLRQAVIALRLTQ